MRGLSRESDMVIVESKPVRTKNPVLIIGFQAPGLVGVTTVSQIINSLKMEEIAYLKSRFIPTLRLIIGLKLMTINPFRMYVNSTGELLTFLNDNPSGLVGLSPLYNDIGKTLVDWLHKKKGKLVVILGSYPLQKGRKPELYAYSTDSKTLEEVRKFGFQTLQQGFLGGIIVSIIDECLEKGIPWLMLSAPTQKITEIDIEGIVILINGLNKMLGLNVETESLKKMRAPRRGFLSSLRRR